MNKGLKINDLSFHLKKLQKEEQINLKVEENKQKAMRKKKNVGIKGKINKTKVSSELRGIVKSNKPLARLFKGKNNNNKSEIRQAISTVSTNLKNEYWGNYNHLD